jgi:hypothetical protein
LAPPLLFSAIISVTHIALWVAAIILTGVLPHRPCCLTLATTRDPTNDYALAGAVTSKYSWCKPAEVGLASMNECTRRQSMSGF